MARTAAGFVEAVWLLVAVLAGLLFQVTAQRSFDFPRVFWLLTLLPWLAVAAGLALAGEPGWRPRPWPLVVAAGLVGSYGLSTLGSVDPSMSLWGSRFNSEGLAAALGYAGLFLAVALLVRRAGQVERLIDVVLLTSVPVALYGVGQYFGRDPLAAAMSQEIAGGRIVSSLGNPILAGGYAAIALPLTLARAVATWRRRDDAPTDSAALALGLIALPTFGLALFLAIAAGNPALWWIAPVPLALFLLALIAPRRPVGRPAALAGYGGLFLLQLLLFYLAGSRGPLVALPLALGLTLFLLLADRPARRLLVAAAAAAALVVLTLVGLPALARAYPRLADAPVVPTLLRVGGPGGTVSSRWLIWQGVLELALGGREVAPPSDRLARLRPLVGYGPETLAMTYERVATAEARRAEPYRISRAHDEPLDALATRGLVGLGQWALTLAAIGLAVWRARRRGTRLLAPLAGAAGGLTAYAVEQLFEPNDPALSLHFWLLAGLVMSPAIQTAGEDTAAVPAPAEPAGALTLAAAGRRSGRPRPAGRAGRERRRTAVAGPTARPWESGSARRRSVAAALAGSGLLLALLAVATGDPPPIGRLVIPWLAAALVGVGWAFLAHTETPARGELGRRAWPLAALALAALLLSLVPYRRLEADGRAKYALEAARRRDHARALALAREAVALAPDDELLYSNLARVLVAAANAAPERPVRPEFRPSDELLSGRSTAAGSKRELLLLAAAALEEAVARAPLEPDNRLNLAIVGRALGDLGEPGQYARAREQLGILVQLAPTQELYREQLAALEGKGV